MFKQIMENTNICELCGTEKELVPAGKRKDGSYYKEFMGCPNWKNHPKTEKKWGKGTSGQEVVVNNFKFEQFVADEFSTLNKRIDGLAEFLKDKFK